LICYSEKLLVILYLWNELITSYTAQDDINISRSSTAHPHAIYKYTLFIHTHTFAFVHTFTLCTHILQLLIYTRVVNISLVEQKRWPYYMVLKKMTLCLWMLKWELWEIYDLFQVAITAFTHHTAMLYQAVHTTSELNVLQ
jgi:hypothetical protein